MQKRIDWIDITKGIGIILMVIGHTSIPQVVSNWIWSFHMPLFFIISGLLYEPRKAAIFTDFLKHKFFTFVIPYFFFLLCDIAYKYLWNKEIPISIITMGDKVGAYWFLQVLLATEILNAFLIKIAERYKWIYVLIIFFISILGYYLSIIKIHFPYRLEVVCLASLHYAFGYLFKDVLMQRKVMWAISVLLLIITFPLSYIIPRLDMNYNQYGSFCPNILAAWFGTITTILVAKNIESHNKIGIVASALKWAGKNSIIIMGLSVPINMSLKHIIAALTLPRLVSSGVQHTLLWIILLLLSFLLKKYTPYLIGVRRNNY
jgi:fucose 4-O-acetylase-like acetyltransferase